MESDGYHQRRNQEGGLPQGYRDFVVKVGLGEIIDRNHEGFLDLLSELCVGDQLLMDIRYQITGFEDHNIITLAVRGDCSESDKP